jgi:hypothetical protein
VAPGEQFFRRLAEVTSDALAYHLADAPGNGALRPEPRCEALVEPLNSTSRTRRQLGAPFAASAEPNRPREVNTT